MGRTSRVVVVGAKETGKTSILEKAIYANSTVGKVRKHFNLHLVTQFRKDNEDSERRRRALEKMMGRVNW